MKKEFDEVKLVEIITKLQKCKGVGLNDDTSLIEDLAMDSISIIGMIVEIEETFDISLEEQMEMQEDSMVYGILRDAVKKACLNKMNLGGAIDEV